MHVLNNFLAFGLALAFGDLTTALNATGGSSRWMILSTLTQSLVYLGLASWVAKAMGLVNVGPPVGGAVPPPSGGPRFGGPAPARVTFGIGSARNRRGGRDDRERSDRYPHGVWCNWQHGWFWSSCSRFES